MRPSGRDSVVRVRGEEDHADAVLPRCRQPDVQPVAFLAQEAVGRLHDDAGTVPAVGLAAARPPVFQVDENLDRLADDVVLLAVLQIGDEADAAGVVLVAGVVQPLRGR